MIKLIKTLLIVSISVFDIAALIATILDKNCAENLPFMCLATLVTMGNLLYFRGKDDEI